MHAIRAEQTIEAAPLFADPKAGDFRRRSGSPALGAARKLIFGSRGFRPLDP
jgi:hypothetical protein